MYKLKLIKLKSYTGAVKVTSKQPYAEVETEKEANALVKTGYFELCEVVEADTNTDDTGNETAAGTNAGETDNDITADTGEETAADTGEDDADEEFTPDYEALSAMTKAQLTQYAEENSISIEGCKTKAEILEAISVFYGGSSTVIDLQQ